MEVWRIGLNNFFEYTSIKIGKGNIFIGYYIHDKYAVKYTQRGMCETYYFNKLEEAIDKYKELIILKK